MIFRPVMFLFCSVVAIHDSGGQTAQYAAMMLRTTEILEALKASPGSYILREAGKYCLKHVDGRAMLKLADATGYPIEPTSQQIEDLIEQSRITARGNHEYILA
jgi:hypothetical protein